MFQGGVVLTVAIKSKGERFRPFMFQGGVVLFNEHQ